MALKNAVLIMALSMAICVQIGLGATFYVDTFGNDSYNGQSWDTALKTIQKAIESSKDGDTIVVNEGRYTESLVFCKDEDFRHLVSNMNRIVTSKNPNDWDVVSHTIIDGNGTENAVRICLGASVRLIGFTITGSTVGVRFDKGAVSTVSNCIIRDNKEIGALIYQSTDIVTNCIIHGNGNTGIVVWSAHGTAKNNLIYDNNEGIGVGGPFTTGIFWNNTVVNNKSYGIRRIGEPNVSISNCIVWNNGDELSNCSAKYSCIKNKGDANGVGDITADPRFVNPSKKDFHIGIKSPCVNAGEPNANYAGQVDIDGQPRVIGERIDIGASEVTSFSQPKKKWFDFSKPPPPPPPDTKQ